MVDNVTLVGCPNEGTRNGIKRFFPWVPTENDMLFEM